MEENLTVTDENESGDVPTLFGEQGKRSPKHRDLENRIREELEKKFEQEKLELSEKLKNEFEERKNKLQNQFDEELKREEAETKIEIREKVEKEIREKVENEFEKEKLEWIEKIKKESESSMETEIEKLKKESEKAERKTRAVVSHLQSELVSSELLVRDVEAREADLIHENEKLRKIIQDKQNQHI